MFRQMVAAIRHAAKEESFLAIFGAGVLLVVTGTVAYSLGEDWSVVDAFYFAVATLTTSSIADPDLVLTNDAMKVFTAFYVLTGIGILVEIARQIGVGFIAARSERSAKRRTRGNHSE